MSESQPRSNSSFLPSVCPQFDLVCSDAWLVDMYQATLNVGFLIGTIATGYLADRWVGTLNLNLVADPAVVSLLLFSSLLQDLAGK